MEWEGDREDARGERRGCPVTPARRNLRAVADEPAPAILPTQEDTDDIIDARTAFVAEALIDAYARGREDERRRWRALAQTSKTTRSLYRKIMGEVEAER